MIFNKKNKNAEESTYEPEEEQLKKVAKKLEAQTDPSPKKVYKKDAYDPNLPCCGVQFK